MQVLKPFLSEDMLTFLLRSKHAHIENISVDKQTILFFFVVMLTILYMPLQPLPSVDMLTISVDSLNEPSLSDDRHTLQPILYENIHCSF